VLIKVARTYLKKHLGVGVRVRPRQRHGCRKDVVCVQPCLWHYHKKLLKKQPRRQSDSGAAAGGSDAEPEVDDDGMTDAEWRPAPDHEAEARLGEHVWGLVQWRAHAAWALEQLQVQSPSAIRVAGAAPAAWSWGSCPPLTMM
jgi:hypothetical protein